MNPEQINRLIAEKCMGWHEHPYYPTSLQSPHVIYTWHDKDDKPMQNVNAFDPYHRIEHAMMALEKFEAWSLVRYKNKFYCEVTNDRENGFPVYWGPPHEVEADTPSAAIAEAIVEALKEE